MYYFPFQLNGPTALFRCVIHQTDFNRLLTVNHSIHVTLEWFCRISLKCNYTFISISYHYAATLLHVYSNTKTAKLFIYTARTLGITLVCCTKTPKHIYISESVFFFDCVFRFSVCGIWALLFTLFFTTNIYIYNIDCLYTWHIYYIWLRGLFDSFFDLNVYIYAQWHNLSPNLWNVWNQFFDLFWMHCIIGNDVIYINFFLEKCVWWNQKNIIPC